MNAVLSALAVAVAALMPVSWIPYALIVVLAVLAGWLVLAATAAPVEPPLARMARGRSIGDVEHWAPPAVDAVSLDVLLYGPPGPVFIQGVGRVPNPPVPVSWQHALDARPPHRALEPIRA